MRHERRWICCLVGAAMFVAPAAASAQENGYAGIKGGVNFAGQYGDQTGGFSYVDDALGTVSASNMEGIEGPVLGVFVTYRATRWLALQPEALLTSKGTVQQVTVGGLDAQFSWKIDYVEIPLLIKLTVPSSSPVVIGAYGGVGLAVVLSAKQQIETQETWSYEYDIDDYVQDNDFSYIFGAGIDVDIGPAVIVLDGRLTSGITSWYVPQSDDAELDIKHQTVSIMAGIATKFGKQPARGTRAQ